jgi:hypothetical protein
MFSFGRAAAEGKIFLNMFIFFWGDDCGTMSFSDDIAAA